MLVFFAVSLYILFMQFSILNIINLKILAATFYTLTPSIVVPLIPSLSYALSLLLMLIFCPAYKDSDIPNIFPGLPSSTSSP